MKTFFSAALLTSAMLMSQAQTLKVITYNLRFDNPNDGINQWSNRKENVFNLLRKYDPDIFGIQEGLHHQLEDLRQNLAYNYLGTGREDGKTKGEYSAIFYKKELFTVLEQNTFWLSETPAVPGSKSWDAAITRVCTWAKFQHTKTKTIFYVFNTHFDHIGKEARAKSSILIKQKIKEISQNNPAILTGDFNTEPSEPPYSIMTGSASILLFDAGKENTEGTFCTFVVNSEPCRRIDYIFYSSAIQSESFKVITDHDGKHYPSDHLPVLAELKIK